MRLYPRILIVGAYIFEGDDATSITIRNLFSNWDKNCIAFLRLSSMSSKAGDKYLTYNHSQFLFGNIAMNDGMSIINSVRASRSELHGVIGAGHKFSVKWIIMNSLHTIISAYRSLIPYSYPSSLNKFIGEFRPDLIYSVLGDTRINNMVSKISRIYNIPIIPHFLDDWPSTMYSNNFILFIPRFFLNLSIRRILLKAPLGFAISKKMADVYNKKYKSIFYPLMNCIEDVSCFKDSLAEIEFHNPIRICYAGGLHLNRNKSLLSFCRALKIISDYDFILSIYSKESDWRKYGDDFKYFKFVTYQGFVDPLSLLNLLNDQDILIHLESFDNEIVKYTRLSISTKIPEYLSLCKPIIAIGPSNIASIEYLAANKCALIIDEDHVDIIKDQVLLFLENREVIEVMRVNARNLFKRNHVLRDQQKFLLERIYEALNSPEV